MTYRALFLLNSMWRGGKAAPGNSVIVVKMYTEWWRLSQSPFPGSVSVGLVGVPQL